MTSRIGSNSGFTLIEVLVASVILFAGLGAVLKAYSAAVSTLDSASDILTSTLLMREKAVDLELQAKGGTGSLNGGGGQIQLDGREYRWEVDAREQSVAPDINILSAVIHLGRVPSGTPHLLQAEWVRFREPATRTPK